MANQDEATMESDWMERFLASFQVVQRHLRRGALTESGRDMTRVQWLILRYLRKVGPVTIGQLADRMTVRSSTMSQMLDRLEREQWIVRKQAEEDSRVRLIWLTEDGRCVIEAVESTWKRRLAVPFQKLTVGEQETLVMLLGKLERGIEESVEDD